MKRWLGIPAALVALLLLFAGGDLAPTPTAAQPFDIQAVAVDLEPDTPAANTATSVGGGGTGVDAGDIQSSLSNVPVGSPFSFDVVVDSVPAQGLFGVGFELNYNVGTVQVTGFDTSQVLQFSSGSASPFQTADPLPDGDGSFRIDSVDLGGTDETGPGRVMRLTAECLSVGTTPLTLTDQAIGADDTAAILNQTTFYTIAQELEGSVTCVAAADTPTPTPTDTPTPTPTDTPDANSRPTPTDADPDRHADAQLQPTTPDADPRPRPDTPTPTPTDTPTPTPTDTPTPTPTDTPTPTPTDTPTPTPTDTPTTDPHRHSHANSHRHADANSHRHADADSHRHTNADPHRHTNADTPPTRRRRLQPTHRRRLPPTHRRRLQPTHRRRPPPTRRRRRRSTHRRRLRLQPTRRRRLPRTHRRRPQPIHRRPLPPTRRLRGLRTSRPLPLTSTPLHPAANTAMSIGGGGGGADAGDIQSLLSVPVGSSFSFDVVVDSVPAQGLFGVGFEVNYAAGILQVTSFDSSQALHFSAGSTIPFETADPLPDNDGSFRVDSVDLSANDETGPGLVMRITAECLSAGTTALTLTDQAIGAGDNAAILSQENFYTIAQELEGSVTCLAADTPTPTPSPPPTPTPSPRNRCPDTVGDGHADPKRRYSDRRDRRRTRQSRCEQRELHRRGRTRD